MKIPFLNVVQNDPLLPMKQVLLFLVVGLNEVGLPMTIKQLKLVETTLFCKQKIYS